MFLMGTNVMCFGAKHSKLGVDGCCQLDLFSVN